MPRSSRGRHGVRKTSVPNIIGTSYTTAQSYLTNLGFIYIYVTSDTNTESDDLKIYSQGISSGQVVPYGTQIPIEYYVYVPPFFPPFFPYFAPPFFPYFPYFPFFPPSFPYFPYFPFFPYIPVDSPSFPYFAPPFFPSFSGGGGCFAYGTSILMSDGSTKLIENIQIGDKLLSLNIPTYPNGEDSSLWYPKETWSINNVFNCSQATTTVTGVRSTTSYRYYLINNKHKVTHEHFIFVKRDGIWQFLHVQELQVGDIFYGVEQEEQIESIIIIDHAIWVVDIDVEENDLYFANDILVHNIKMAM